MTKKQRRWSCGDRRSPHASLVPHPSSLPHLPRPCTKMRAPKKEKYMSDIKRVGVLGCGLMGSGIAQVAAQAGYETIVREVEQKFLDKGIGGIEKSLGKFVEKGRMAAADRDACLGRLKGTVKLEDLADCDIVIEAIIENAALKKETYAALDKIVKKDALFASNTSSLTNTELSMATTRPAQFVR